MSQGARGKRDVTPESPAPVVSERESLIGGLSTVMPTALVVQPSVEDAFSCMTVLSNLRFDVTVAGTFAQARTAVAARMPTLLVTDIRLGQYNGLHLVLRARSGEHPLAAIVTSRMPDSVLQQEAERLGATFVLMPTPIAELSAAVVRTVFRASTSAAAIRAPFERRTGDRRVAAAAAAVTANRRGRERRRSLAALLSATG